MSDDCWHQSDIPEHKRRHMHVDEEGFLTIRLRSARWITAGGARERIAKALSIDPDTAAAAIHTRLISGHIIASAAAVYGPIKMRERIRIAGGRDMIPNNHWQWIKPTESLWLLGDLQMRAVGSDVSFLRSITYTDVQFLEQNVGAVIAAANPSSEPANVVETDLLSPLGEASPEARPASWTDAEMRAAIARCPERNRDTAWNVVFKPQRDVHGWDVNAFRKVWSDARGTKGMAGRPSERA